MLIVFSYTGQPEVLNNVKLNISIVLFYSRAGYPVPNFPYRISGVCFVLKKIRQHKISVLKRFINFVGVDTQNI